MLFGIVPSSCSVYIREMLQLICQALEKCSSSRIRFPSFDEMENLARLVKIREPLVDNVIGFIDGLRLPVECSSDEIAQSVDYSGYNHDTMCNNVFVFSSSGKIVLASINCPGSWHDSSTACDLLAFLRDNLNGYKICADKRFPLSKHFEDKLVGPLTTKQISNLQRLSTSERNAKERLHNAYTSLRQSAEWGMRALQGTFCRLKTRLCSNKNKRKLVIRSIILLHNFRTHYIGLNQIAVSGSGEA